MDIRQLPYIILFAIIASVSACRSTNAIPIGNLESGVWTEVRASDGSLPIERHEAAFVGVGDQMYLLGGRGIKAVSIYHPEDNKWTQGSEPPIELHHFQPVVYEGEIYICGALTGQYPGETPVPNIYIYNPSKDDWRKGPAIPMDRRRGGAGAVVDGDNLYLICGIKDGHRGDHKKWTDVYNLKSQQWLLLEDAPRARDHFQSIYADGKIYNLGGRTTISSDNPFKNTIGEVDVYDIVSKTWSTLSESIPTQRAGNFAIAINNELVVLGGETFEQELAHSQMEALNIKKHSWKSLADLPRGRHGTGVIYYEGALYTASGCGKHGGKPELSDLWKFEWPHK